MDDIRNESHPSVPSVPSDNTTLTDILDAFDEGGFDHAIEVGEDATLICRTCGYTDAPSHFSMHTMRRLEGASDPDDMMAVIGVECPVCQSKAAVILQYGPMAPAEHAVVLHDVHDERDVTASPRDMAPFEAVDPDAAGPSTPNAA